MIRDMMETPNPTHEISLQTPQVKHQWHITLINTGHSIIGIKRCSRHTFPDRHHHHSPYSRCFHDCLISFINSYWELWPAAGWYVAPYNQGIGDYTAPSFSLCNRRHWKGKVMVVGMTRSVCVCVCVQILQSTLLYNQITAKQMAFLSASVVCSFENVISVEVHCDLLWTYPEALVGGVKGRPSNGAIPFIFIQRWIFLSDLCRMETKSQVN